MIERRGCLRLALETFQSLAVLSQRLGQELEGDKPVQPGVFSFVDHAHTAATELFKNAVVRNRLANHEFETGNWKLEIRNSKFVGVRPFKARPGTTDQPDLG